MQRKAGGWINPIFQIKEGLKLEERKKGMKK